MLQLFPHYELKVLKSIDDVKKIIDDLDTTRWDLNWVFLSTSGVHGSYITLDELEAWDEDNQGEEYPWPRSITILIVHPRLVVVRYGEIDIQPEDVSFLRECVKQTIIGIAESQKGNLPAEAIWGRLHLNEQGLSVIWSDERKAQNIAERKRVTVEIRRKGEELKILYEKRDQLEELGKECDRGCAFLVENTTQSMTVCNGRPCVKDHSSDSDHDHRCQIHCLLEDV